MKNPLLALNTMVVNTLCPVHIGTGNKLRSFDYVIEGDMLVVIDEKKLMDWVASDPRGQLASDLATLIQRNGSMKRFLNDRNRRTSEFAAYRVKIETANPMRDLMPFIKTPFHRPYLPGSSLKGSLRSTLMRGAMLERDELRRWVSDTVREAAAEKRPASASESIQAKVFVQAEVKRALYSNYDVNRVLVVRDSTPKLARDLEVVEVKLLTVSDNRLRDKPNVVLFIEALRPGLTLHLPVTWQTHLLLGQGPAAELKLIELRRMMIYLPEFCRAASLQMLQQEVEFYGKHGHDLAGWYEAKRDLLKASADEVFILPMGWGSGYDAKTVTDLLDQATFKIVADNLRNTEGLGRPGNSLASRWLGPELSPKSRKVVVRDDGKMEPLGWLAVAFRSEEEAEKDWLTQARKHEAALRPKIDLPTVSARPARRPPPASPPTQSESVRAEASAPQETVTPPSHMARPLIRSFNELPNTGDRFKGAVWFTDEDDTIFVEIPGLSPDDFAVATIAPQDNPERRKFREGTTVACEVISVVADPKQAGHWLVKCRRA